MLESDKGKHVVPVGKLPPESERIISWERTRSRLRDASSGEET